MKLILFVIFFTSTHCFASNYQSCDKDISRLKKRQKEITKIVAKDQEDRVNQYNIPPSKWNAIRKNDLVNRKRIGEIFGEGCLVTAKDFANAALVFQHGDTPDHFWQAFVFAMHAVRLGDKSQKIMAANAIDRYLVQKSIGKKQLFARNATKPTGQKCWCLQQVEKTFPDSLRISFTGKSYKDQLNWIKEINEESGNSSCPATECKDSLSPTPKGSVAGLW